MKFLIMLIIFSFNFAHANDSDFLIEVELLKESKYKELYSIDFISSVFKKLKSDSFNSNLQRTKDFFSKKSLHSYLIPVSKQDLNKRTVVETSESLELSIVSHEGQIHYEI